MGFVREKKFRLMILSFYLSLSLFFKRLPKNERGGVIDCRIHVANKGNVWSEGFFFFFIRIYLSLPVYFDTDTSKVSRANPFPLDSRESGGREGEGWNEARESLSHHRSFRVFLHSFAVVSSDKVGQCLTSVFLHLVPSLLFKNNLTLFSLYNAVNPSRAASNYITHSFLRWLRAIISRSLSEKLCKQDNR